MGILSGMLSNIIHMAEAPEKKRTLRNMPEMLQFCDTCPSPKTGTAHAVSPRCGAGLRTFSVMGQKKTSRKEDKGPYIKKGRASPSAEFTAFLFVMAWTELNSGAFRQQKKSRHSLRIPYSFRP